MTSLKELSYDEYTELEEKAFNSQQLQDEFILKNFGEFEQEMSENHVGHKDPFFCDYEYSWIEKNTTKFLEFALEKYNK